MSKIKDLLARAISLASEQPMSYKEAVELLDGIDTCRSRSGWKKGLRCLRMPMRMTLAWICSLRT